MKEGYKKTEIGVIPEDWEFRTLEQISEFITKGSTPTTYGFDWVEKGILFMKSDCVYDKGFKLGDTMQISQEAHEYMKRSEVKSGDLLISITGNIGRVGIIPNYIKEANINQHIARIRVQDIDNVNNKYLYYTLSRKEVLDYYEKIKTGLAYPQISLKQVRETKVILPPLKEQEKIAEILSTVDCQIDDTEKLIEKCRVLKKGLMQRLLTKGIGHTEFKKTEVGEIPVGWEVVSIGEISNVKSSKRVYKSDYIEKGIPFYRSKEIIELSKNIEPTVELFIDENKYNEFKVKFGAPKKGDLMITSVGSVGKTWVSDGREFYYKDGNLTQIDINEKINTSFISYLFDTEYLTKQYLGQSNGSAQVALTLEKLKKLVIALPTRDEQEKIVEVLSSVDSEIEEYKCKKENLEELKKGLMQLLLTGKKRVDNNY